MPNGEPLTSLDNACMQWAFTCHHDQNLGILQHAMKNNEHLDCRVPPAEHSVATSATCMLASLQTTLMLP